MPFDKYDVYNSRTQPEQFADKLNQEIAGGSGGSSTPADGSISTTMLADNAVTAAKIASKGVTFAKSKVFVSSVQTGTGSAQSIAHGLGAVPAAVMITPYDLTPATAGDYTVTEGTHTTSNVVATVTSGKKYKVLAWA